MCGEDVGVPEGMVVEVDKDGLDNVLHVVERGSGHELTQTGFRQGRRVFLESVNE
jgi:hypothetical protein